MAVIVDHKKSPCEANFLKQPQMGKRQMQNQSLLLSSVQMIDTTSVYLIFIRMLHDHDFNTWLQMAKCLHVWDLDARGYHRGMWRLHYNGVHLLIIGVPYSPYSVFKPPHVMPLQLSKLSSSSSTLKNK